MKLMFWTATSEELILWRAPVFGGGTPEYIPFKYFEETTLFPELMAEIQQTKLKKLVAFLDRGFKSLEGDWIEKFTPKDLTPQWSRYEKEEIATMQVLFMLNYHY